MIERIGEKGLVISDLHNIDYMQFSSIMDEALRMPFWEWCKIPQASDKPYSRSELLDKRGIWNQILVMVAHQKLMQGKYGRVSQEVCDSVMSVGDAEYVRRAGQAEQKAIDEQNVGLIWGQSGIIIGVDVTLEEQLAKISQAKSMPELRPSARTISAPSGRDYQRENIAPISG